MVREVKGVTGKPYEKSRLVIQGHSDEGKESILTQSSTIQRVSQRLIVAIAASMGKMSLELDKVQAGDTQRTRIRDLWHGLWIRPRHCSSDYVEDSDRPTEPVSDPAHRMYRLVQPVRMPRQARHYQ